MGFGFPKASRTTTALIVSIGGLAVATGLIAMSYSDTAARFVDAPACTGPGEPIWVDGGTFEVGSGIGYPEERNLQKVTVEGFWMSSTEVTVSQFAEFAAATDYVTMAEREVDPAAFDQPPATEAATALLEPGGAVFQSNPTLRGGNGWWRYVAGANWQRPEGPSGRPASPNDPVTQITIADALAYADWAGGRVPTEAEWEYAALAGGADPALNAPAPANANTWQGVFPVQDLGDDGFAGVAPVGCFPPNAFGLHDMLGNVWEITFDGKASRLPDTAPADRPEAISYTTIKGGSFLCADNFCRRYRPAARQAQEADLATNHIGFRIIYERPPQPKYDN